MKCYRPLSKMGMFALRPSYPPGSCVLAMPIVLVASFPFVLRRILSLRQEQQETRVKLSFGTKNTHDLSSSIELMVPWLVIWEPQWLKRFMGDVRDQGEDSWKALRWNSTCFHGPEIWDTNPRELYHFTKSCDVRQFILSDFAIFAIFFYLICWS